MLTLLQKKYLKAIPLRFVYWSSFRIHIHYGFAVILRNDIAHLKPCGFSRAFMHIVRDGKEGMDLNLTIQDKNNP